MFVSERQDAILTLLKESGSVQAVALAERFGLSLATIRRDLDALQGQGLIRRVYGGAVFVPLSRPTDQYFTDRMDTHGEQKQSIGKAAAALVRPGETIMLDIGTTVLEIARCIHEVENLTVLTSSLPVLNELANTNVCVYALGGQLRPKELAMAGHSAVNMLKSFCVDKAFIGAGGISLTNGLTDYNYDSAHLRNIAINRASQSILVSDSSKFGADAFAIVCDIDKIDVVVTDEGIPGSFIDAFRARKIQLIVAT